MRKMDSIIAIMTAFLWAILLVCSDDVLVYADYDCEESITLSSVLVDGTDLWSESSTDFVLQDFQALRNRMRNNGYQSRMRNISSALLPVRCELEQRQWRKYICSLDFEPYLNQKIIMNYLHRQDGDK